jgi:hypothetical protein
VSAELRCARCSEPQREMLKMEDMMSLEVTLAPDAVVYIRQRLSEGGTLAKLLESCALEAMQLVTYIPTSSIPRAQDLSIGGATSRATSERWLTTLVLQFLRSGEDKCVIYEDAVARAGDPLPEDDPYITYGPEVYYYNLVKMADPAAITRVIHYATSYRFLCLFASLPGLNRLRPGLAVELAVLQQLAARIEGLAVGAYDQEGFLVAR